MEVHADLTVALGPAGRLVLVDVERLDDFLLAEIGCHALEVGRPGHAARRVVVLQAHVVHVVALLFAAGADAGGRLLKHVLQDLFAFRVVDLVGVFGEFQLAETLLVLEPRGEVRALLHKTLLVGELEVGVVLLSGRHPAVADEETSEVPFVTDGSGVLVAFNDGLGDVGNVLTGVGLSGDIELEIRQLKPLLQGSGRV